ncbi:ABC transporter permease [Yinghuangia soli]|uniref:ABC transporter permease n=1 Tax=Yinghuangia soli TaxID=2908204 RepID=A0AA41TXV9_9ACTN|nr:ABC transporter permease [Yinghuangia soli]MCF2527233.1 ABC transporter permease [Yinghuangia soli]
MTAPPRPAAASASAPGPGASRPDADRPDTSRPGTARFSPARLAWLRSPVVLGVPAAAIAAGVAVLLVIGSGATPAEAGQALADGMFGTDYAIGVSFNGVAVLMLIAVGFSVAHRVGLVNVGGEGQLCLGALAGTAVGVKLGDGLPRALGTPLVLAAGFAAGALWAGIAAYLKVRRGTSEVITTLLLNFVGIGLVSLAVHEEALLRQPVTSSETLPQSEPVASSGRLPLLDAATSPATIAIVVAVASALVVAVVLRHTATGLRLKAAGRSAPAARRAGLPVGRLEGGALAVAGGFAGLAGAVLVATAPYVLDEGLSSGYGFAGLVVGLLARGSLTAVAAVALLLGFLVSGGINLQIAAGVPASTVQVAQSVLVVCIAGAMRWTAARPGGGAR